MSSRALFQIAFVLALQLAIVLALQMVKCHHAECGESGHDSSIKLTGKDTAEEGMWPWMVSIHKIESPDSSIFICAGFLIDRKHVISAAHCFYEKDDEYMIRVGSINQKEGDEYRINRIAIPSNYTTGMFYGDIALLTLHRKVDFADYSPVCLPDDVHGKMDLAGGRTVIAGWNIDYIFDFIDKDLKYQSGLTVIPNEECERLMDEKLRGRFQRQFPQGINREFVCATHPGVDAGECPHLTSGGPLMIQHENRWTAIGVISFGFKCGLPGVPDGYASITNYLKWIRQNARKQL